MLYQRLAIYFLKAEYIIQVMNSAVKGLKLVSNKIDTYLTSLWRHERYLFSVFRGILPADISTVFEEIKHLRSRAPEKYFTRLLK